MEPPYAERHVRWCERTHEEIILMLLLDFIGEQKKEAWNQPLWWYAQSLSVCYFSTPRYTNAFFPKSSSAVFVSSGLNKPNTDEPEPVIAAYIAPCL